MGAPDSPSLLVYTEGGQCTNLAWHKAIKTFSLACKYLCMPEKKNPVPGQDKIGTYQFDRAGSCWWNKTSFTSYVVNVSASLNMLTDRTSFLMLVKL